MEEAVLWSDPMPDGYCFVPKGDVYITANCRRRTLATGGTLYVVADSDHKPVGLRCLRNIYEDVLSDSLKTAEARAQRVKVKDDKDRILFEGATLKQFPATPAETIKAIARHAMLKHSKRVGRTGTLSLNEKVNCAVRAHIRHRYTDYEKLLKSRIDRFAARRHISNQVLQMLRQWAGSNGLTPRAHKGKMRLGSNQSMSRALKQALKPTAKTCTESPVKPILKPIVKPTIKPDRLSSPLKKKKRRRRQTAETREPRPGKKGLTHRERLEAAQARQQAGFRSGYNTRANALPSQEHVMLGYDSDDSNNDQGDGTSEDGMTYDAADEDAWIVSDEDISDMSRASSSGYDSNGSDDGEHLVVVTNDRSRTRKMRVRLDSVKPMAE